MIYQVHYDYLVAGADIITSASYQATFPGLAAKGLSPGQASEIFYLSVKLAKQAIADFWDQPENRVNRLRPLVAASIGPYGAMLADGSEYHGNYGLTHVELMDFHRPRIKTLVNCDVDLLAFETIPSYLEGAALAQLLTEFPNTFAWLSFSCCDKLRVCHGELLTDCVNLANTSDQIVAVGVNCTPPIYLESLIEQAVSATTKPIIVYPNSGEKWDATHHCWVNQEVDTLMQNDKVPIWIEKGARIIGGCCRTTPTHIADFRKKLFNNTMI